MKKKTENIRIDKAAKIYMINDKNVTTVTSFAISEVLEYTLHDILARSLAPQKINCKLRVHTQSFLFYQIIVILVYKLHTKCISSLYILHIDRSIGMCCFREFINLPLRASLTRFLMFFP